jgi:hypothetical protein
MVEQGHLSGGDQMKSRPGVPNFAEVFARMLGSRGGGHASTADSLRKIT